MKTKSLKAGKLPHVVYVHLEGEKEDEYFICNDNIEAAATLDEKRIVGIYKLEKVVEVSTDIVQKEI